MQNLDAPLISMSDDRMYPLLALFNYQRCSIIRFVYRWYFSGASAQKRTREKYVGCMFVSRDHVARVHIRKIFLRIAVSPTSYGSSHSRAVERPDADENHDGEDPVAQRQWEQVYSLVLEHVDSSWHQNQKDGVEAIRPRRWVLFCS